MSNIQFGEFYLNLYDGFRIDRAYFPADRERPHMNSLHIHNTAELMIVESGNATLRIESELYKAHDSYLVYFPARSVHFSVNNRGYEYSRYCLSLDESYFIGEIELPKNGFVLPLSQDELDVLIAPATQLYKYFAHSSGEANEHLRARRDCLLRWLMIEVNALYGRADGGRVEPRGSYIGKVCGLIEHGISEKPNLDRLAEQFFICKSKLTRDFREETGMSVGEYIDAVRISRAKQMLEQGASVSDTAHACGFTGSANFIRFFKQHSKLTPAKYRAEMMCEGKSK